ncbi:Thiol-disulfide isomerase or thioredoxin [Alteribacillus persepolensis]|uniref:Thiol-disulfide isomerase or thioredoxin n=1 Tax=Alteribacillus persepolensis TaxID=568899 RepID=A0A1G8KH79_9BACI|nr:thioredoxin family protein [Alteribacillus persepolensis]SDI42230.1 Thiol-disulfide isomerase or thioredoxin [Alteribacillus persepolensis]
MQTIETRQAFDSAIQQSKTVVMFSADWCPDCHVIEPALPQIEKNNNDFTFYHIDRDEFIDVCQEYDIFGIPSFIAFHHGKEVHRLVSKMRKTPEEVQQFLNETTMHIDQ